MSSALVGTSAMSQLCASGKEGNAFNCGNSAPLAHKGLILVEIKKFQSVHCPGHAKTVTHHYTFPLWLQMQLN